MIPLGAMMLLGIYIFAERYIAIRNAAKIDANFMNIIRDNIISGNVTAARNFAKNTNNPVARIIDKGIQRIGKPIDGIEKVWPMLVSWKCTSWRKTWIYYL